MQSASLKHSAGLREIMIAPRHAACFCGIRAPRYPVQRRLAVRVRNSAAGYPSGTPDDPYKILGVPMDADSNAIARAYRVKKYEARGNDKLSQKIENAHDKLMMSALSARLKGGGAVSKDILYADREPLFPWRPKRWDATPRIIMIFGAICLVLTAYGFQSPSISKVVGCLLLGVVGNVMKQNAINPPPKDASMATEEERGRAGRNFVRGGLLAVLATMGGVLLCTAPEYLSQTFNFRLPAPLNDSGFQVSLKVAGSAICNWIMTSFYY